MDIQKLKEWAEDEREKALADCMKIKYDLNNEASLIPRRLYSAFSQIITAAELLLLNKPTGAITEAAHFANTMLSEVPTSENDTHIGDVGAGSSETEIVKQNEQIRKSCATCLHNYLDQSRYICVVCDSTLSEYVAQGE